MTLDEFNALDETGASEALALCCVSDRWIGGVLAERPFASAAALGDAADRVWRSLGEADFLQAFAGHPKIGDVNSLRAKYAASGSLAASEQAGVSEAADDVIARLAQGNREYQHRFGFIFIVCATGKSAAQMCELLEQRLHNDRATELLLAAEEQRKILQIRLEKLL